MFCHRLVEKDFCFYEILLPYIIGILEETKQIRREERLPNKKFGKRVKRTGKHGQKKPAQPLNHRRGKTVTNKTASSLFEMYDLF